MWAFGEFYLGCKPESWFVQLESEKEKALTEHTIDETKLPSFGASIFPILFPIVLILLSSIGSQILPGAFLGSHVNNSFTWVFSEFMGYDIKTTLKTLCVGQNLIMSFSALAAVFVIMLMFGKEAETESKRKTASMTLFRTQIQKIALWKCA